MPLLLPISPRRPEAAAWAGRGLRRRLPRQAAPPSAAVFCGRRVLLCRGVPQAGYAHETVHTPLFLPPLDLVEWPSNYSRFNVFPSIWRAELL